MASSQVVGIDVSSKKLDIFFLNRSNNKEKTKKVNNAKDGYKELEKLITNDTRLVLEATGVYHYNLSKYFHQKGYTVSVVNPRAIKYYGMAKMLRDKTDKVDAKLIYDYGKNMLLTEQVKVRDWETPSEVTIKRQQLLTMIQLEKKHLSAYEAQYYSFKSCCDTSGTVYDLILEKIKVVKTTIKDYEKELRKLNSDEDKVFLKLVKTISGIGDKCAMVFLHTFGGFHNFENAKQAICYLGTNPREYESGTSIKKNKGISKMGVKEARKLLFMAAMSAKKHNPACKSLYVRLRARGKKHKQAMVAVMNKLLKQAFAIVKSGEEYNPNYHSLPH